MGIIITAAAAIKVPNVNSVSVPAWCDGFDGWRSRAPQEYHDDDGDDDDDDKDCTASLRAELVHESLA